MSAKATFEYAIIRVVPKVERGEFLNVGVIVLAKSKDFLAMKYHLNESRLTGFSPDIDLEKIDAYLQAWKWICAGSEKGGRIGKLPVPERFRWLTATRSTIIQSSEVHPGLCSDPVAKLEDLFQKYVL